MPRNRLILLLAAAAACSKAGAESIGGEAEAAVPVAIAPVARATVRDTTEYVATLKSRRSVALHPQVDGQVAAILVHSGDRVKRGRLLMQIDPSRELQSVSSQKATVLSKQAALAYAQREYERVETLYRGGAASRQELDLAKSALDAAGADVEALGAAVRAGEVQLHWFSIVAPEDGVVGDVPVRVGDYVNPQTELTTVDQNDRLELYVAVPVERVAQVRLGLPVELLDSSGAKLAESRIAFVSSEVDPDTQAVLLKAIVENPTGALRTSQFVRARLVWSERQGPVLPFDAVKRFNGQPFAFAAVEVDGKLVARQRPVSLGPLDEGVYPVLAGLSAGEKIVVEGAQKLHDGAPIVPAKG